MPIPRKYAITAPQNAAVKNRGGAGQSPADAVVLYERAASFVKAEADAWKRAVVTARNPETPRRALLYALMDSALWDGHLDSAIDKRRMRVTGMSFRLVDAKGAEVPEAKAALETKGFGTILRILAEVPVKGPCCIMLTPVLGGFPAVKLLNPAHYVPEFKSVLRDPSDSEALALDLPGYEPFFLHVFQDSPRDLGKLWKALPLIISKRAASLAWSQFADRFGQPMRVLKTAVTDRAQLAQLDQRLKDMGRDNTIRLPYSTDFQLLMPNVSDAYKVFDELMTRSNNELSKLIEGQTMTSDSGSSRSQSEVHADTAELYRYEDAAFVASAINETVLPALEAHGVAVKGLRFEWVEQDEIEPSISLETDRWLQEKFQIPSAHWSAKYGVEIKGEKGAAVPAALPPATPKTAALRGIVASVAGHTCPACAAARPVAAMATGGIDEALRRLRTALARLARSIFDGEAAGQDWDILRECGRVLEAAAAEGFDLEGLTWDSPDLMAAAVLRANAWRFADARTASEARAIRAELTDEQGLPREWPAFKKAVEALHDDYFGPWLKAEYDAARMASISARQWNDILQDEDDYPNLEYNTVGDSRVRSEHARLDGLTRPVDDPIWARIFPPNGWGCRCDVIQRGPAAKPSDDEDAEAGRTAVAEGWEFNPGKELKFWPAGHAYLADMQARGHEAYGFAPASGMRKAKASPKPASQDEIDRLKEAGGVTGATGGLAWRMPDGWDDTAARQLVALAKAQPHERWVALTPDGGMQVRNVWFFKDLIHRLDLLIEAEGCTVSAFAQDGEGIIDNKRRGTPWPIS